MASRYAASRCPLLGGGPHPALGADVTAVLQQVGERVGAQRVALLGGLAQPVLGGGLVARARGGGGPARARRQRSRRRRRYATSRRPRRRSRAGAAGRPGCWRRRGPPRRWRRAAGARLRRDRRGAAASRRARSSPRRRRLGGAPVTCLSRLSRSPGRASAPGPEWLHKPPCLQQSCLVPHNVHRRTTCNLGTPGISQPVRSLQRFVDMPTERQVKHEPAPTSGRPGPFPARHTDSSGRYATKVRMSRLRPLGAPYACGHPPAGSGPGSALPHSTGVVVSAPSRSAPLRRVGDWRGGL